MSTFTQTIHMSEKDQLLSRLQKMLAWKKSRRYYAERLGITEEEVASLIKELEGDESQPTVFTDIPGTLSYKEDLKNGTAEISTEVKEEIKNLEDLIIKCKIDIEKWDVLRYIQNFWGNGENPKWQVKAWLTPKAKGSKFTDEFKTFLRGYRSPAERVERTTTTASTLTDACLVINKQDAHFNKYDIQGRNDIIERFEIVEEKVDKMVAKASLSNDLEKIVYIIGSDQFNSEWTGCTTRGTPQQNLPGFQGAFELICDHEVRVIDSLLKSTNNLHILYISGNHDEYVGWHMIKWIQAYYRNQLNLTIDTSHLYRKYVQYGSSALMFNHGDAMKPQALAQLFPIEFRDNWSNCENYYIFTGDKHREINADFNGIKFYGIPALSTARGLWDHKQGYTGTKAEMTGFVITYSNGLSDIYKELL